MKSSSNFAAAPEKEILESTLKNVKSVFVLLSAGKGTRTGLPYNKMFYETGEADVLSMTIMAANASASSHIVIVYSPSDEEIIKSHLPLLTKPYTITAGGDTRSDSVRNGLNAVGSGSWDIAVIHDGARPFVSPELIDNSIYTAFKEGSAITAVTSVDQVRVIENGKIKLSPEKSDTLIIQTPQSFNYRKILEAYGKINGSYGDDCEVYAMAGNTPVFTEGSYANRKVTTREDLLSLSSGYRIGTGFDVHQLTEGRKLILGGIEIPFRKGLLGHSDADVLTHAVMDALLSAASLPDIGVLFPDNDDSYKGISSILLLKEVLKKVTENFGIINISAVIMAQKPKLAEIIPLMRRNLSEVMEIETDRINISATTTEKLGIIGEEKGIAVSAVCLIARKTVDKNSK